MKPVSRYSSFLPDVHTLNQIGGSLLVNTSGRPDPSGTGSQFTVAGWIRFQAGTQRLIYAVTAAGGVPLFTISADSGGSFSAEFAGQSGVRSYVSIADGAWHYIAVSYLGSNASDPQPVQTLRLYLDGSLLDDKTTNLALLPAEYRNLNNYIGNVHDIDFASWEFWSQAEVDDYMDVPDWGTPRSDAPGLVKVFNFTEGVLEALTPGQGFTPLPPQPLGDSVFNWNTACLQLPAQGFAVNIPATNVAGLNAPFTIMGHMSSSTAVVPYPGLVTFLGPMGFMYTCDPAQNKSTWQPMLMTSAGTVTGPALSFPDAGSAAPAWRSFAISYDGQAITFYLDDQQYTMPNQPGLFPATGASIPLAKNGSVNFTLLLQDVSIWQGASTLQQIDARFGSSNLGDDPSCLAWFLLMTDLGDSKNGYLLTMSPLPDGGPTVVGEIQTAVSGSPDPERLRQRDLRSRAVDDPSVVPVMRYKDYVALAMQHGIDPNAVPSGQAARDTDYLAGLEVYDNMLAQVRMDPNLATRMRERFKRHLFASEQLARVAPQAGRFFTTETNGSPTLFYGSVLGPRAIGEWPSEAVRSEIVDWKYYFNVGADLVALVVLAFGISASAANVKKVLDSLGPTLQRWCVAVRDAVSAVDASSNFQKFITAIFTFLQLVVAGRGLVSLVWQISTASWWSIGFTVASIILQILATLLTGGAALMAVFVVRCAQIALAVVVLLKDLALLLAQLGNSFGTAAEAIA